MSFTARQGLDTLSLGNFPWTNPEVVETALRDGGANLLRGGANLLDDLARQATGRRPACAGAFRVGLEVACTSAGWSAATV